MILRGINAFARSSPASAAVLMAALVATSLPLGRAQPSLDRMSTKRSECRGVSVTGGGDALERAVNGHGPGTTFCIGEGTYKVSRNGLKLQDGDVLNGAGRARPGTGGARPLVRILGRGSSVVWGGDRVRLRDVSITDAAKNTKCSSATACGQIVKPGNGWRIEGARLHHADAQCIGSPGHSLVIVNSELDHCGNRFDGKDQNGFAGAIKGGINGAFTIRQSYVHDNNQGVWCDVDCSSRRMPFTVLDSRILNNYSFGIHYEHTTKNPKTPAAAIIKGNVVRGNNWGKLSTKGDIGIMSAKNARVKDNQVGATKSHPGKGKGITFRNTNGRGAASGTTSGNLLNGDSLDGCSLSGVLCKKTK